MTPAPSAGSAYPLEVGAYAFEARPQGRNSLLEVAHASTGSRKLGASGSLDLLEIGDPTIRMVLDRFRNGRPTRRSRCAVRANAS